MSQGEHDDGNITGTAVAGGEDRIGALPDNVLKHLLSFLPSRNSVRTCVLAKRWRTLWKSVPALRMKDDPSIFCGNQAPSGWEAMFFADELLHRRDSTPLDVCEIYSCYHYANSMFNSDDDDEYINMLDHCTRMKAFERIEPWIQYALSHEVRVLQLQVEGASLTTNLALVSSHLKRIELTFMNFESSLDFSSCPVLDVLEMTSCYIYANILSQSVRHLSIKDGSFSRKTRSRISAPNLISLKLDQDTGLPILLDSMPSLAAASVDESNNYKQHGEEGFSVVLEGLSSATNLELITPHYQNSVFRMDFKWCTIFSKLKTLLLNDWCLADNFTGMIYFLQHSPILETFTLQLNFKKYEEYYVSETYESCNSREQGHNSRDQSLLLKHLKAVKIICGKKEDVIVQRVLNILCTHGVSSEQIDIQ